MIRRAAGFFCLCFCLITQLYATERGPGIQLPLQSDSSHVLNFYLWSQLWFRAIENNPGTWVNGQPEAWSSEVAVRRARMMLTAQLGPRWLLVTHLGINNQSFSQGGAPLGGVTGGGGNFTAGKKPGLFFHDVWQEYAWKTDAAQSADWSLYTGIGLHFWNGFSRMSSPSTIRFLTLDAPMFNWLTLELTDQFGRQMGVYAKGHFKQWQYRMSLNKPFAVNELPPVVAGARTLNQAVDNNAGNPWAAAGYFVYQFFDREDHHMPFTAGTWLGKKKLLQLGAGFYSSQGATVSNRLGAANDTLLQKHAALSVSLDVFVEWPLRNNTAFTAYSVAYWHQWGPNYYRTVGVMNPGSNDPNFVGQRSDNGPGNARPLLGSGSLWYTQAGYLMPPLGRQKIQLQPFAAISYHDLQFFKQPAMGYDAGINLLLDGQRAKISLQYAARPLLFQQQPRGHRAEWLVQTQLYL